MKDLERIMEILEQSGVLTLGKKADKIDHRLDNIESHISGVKKRLHECHDIVANMHLKT